MRNIFLRKNKDAKEAKDVILKVFFSAEKQKQAVIRAAEESAEDQRALLEQYKKVHPKTA